MSDEIKKEQKNKKKIYILVGLILVSIAIISCISLNYFTKNYLYNGKIANNIFIENVDVSNMTKSQAVEAIKEKYNPQDLSVYYKNDSYKISCEDINLKYNTNELVNKAYSITRTGSYFKDIASYMDVKSKGEQYSIKVTYDDKKLEKILETFSNEINRESKSAKVSVGRGINITESQTGLKVEIEKNKELIIDALKNKKYENIELNVTVVQPRVLTEDVASINTCLASFSTTFNANLVDRSYNIGLAAQRCNNVILLPGETFSYNEQTGSRTLSNGYKNAPVIINGSYSDGPGGGVCQTSTTVFNAALLSGLKIDKVRNHSKTSHYAQRGRDAMVNDSDSDLKFTNNFDHAVYVVCYRSGSSVNAAIYGASQDRVGVSIKVDNFTYNGKPGAKTYRTITKNGKSETSHIYTSVYQE